MEEDEEINIMDINVPLVSQNTELSNLEYTVHPQWLSDKRSKNPDCWYNGSFTKSENNKVVSIGAISTENVISDDSGWTEKEKNLLERGIEIFGKSAIRLSQFIGTKTPSDIRSYLKCFYTKNETDPQLNDSEIPCTSDQLIVKLRSNLPVKKGKLKVKSRISKKKVKSKSGNKPNIFQCKSEEIVKIEKTDNSDSEIDIEDVDEIVKGNVEEKNKAKLGKILKHEVIKSSPLPKRFKRKFLNNGEGGCTVSHGDNGEIIETTIIDKEPTIPQKTLKIPRKPPTYLIKCSPYNDEDFHIVFNVSALFLMDFHAHSSLTEIMGLLGGSQGMNSKILKIQHYEPCKNQASSTTHCDMCPVSQSNSAERIRNLNMNLTGWFHSHPTFAPEPSQQDLDTQNMFQDNIGGRCVGIILSPFNRPISVPSEFRCIIVERNKNYEFVPFKIRVEIDCDDFDEDGFLRDLCRVKNFIKENQQEITFDKRYFNENMNYLDKFIASFRMMFDKYFENKEKTECCERLVKKIYDIFRN